MINSIENIGGLSATKCCSNMLNTCREPYAEHLALRALLPAGGCVAKLRVWTSYLHALEAERSRAAALAEQVATSTTSLGPRVSDPSTALAAFK